MTKNNATERALGKIEGELKGIGADVGELKVDVKSIDTRLRAVEQKATRNGAIAGGVLGITVSLIAATMREKLGL